MITCGNKIDVVPRTFYESLYDFAFLELFVYLRNPTRLLFYILSGKLEFLEVYTLGYNDLVVDRLLGRNLSVVFDM